MYSQRKKQQSIVSQHVLSLDILILNKKLQKHGLPQDLLRHVRDCVDTLRQARKLLKKKRLRATTNSSTGI